MSSYLDWALKETEKVDAPAVGFSRTAGLGGTSGNSVQIRQNNTIIQLLLQQAEDISEIKAELKLLKQKVFSQGEPSGTKTVIPDQIIDELSKKLEGFSITGGKKIGAGERGQLKVFKDPYVILKEEQEKLKRKQ